MAEHMEAMSAILEHIAKVQGKMVTFDLWWLLCTAKNQSKAFPGAYGHKHLAQLPGHVCNLSP